MPPPSGGGCRQSEIEGGGVSPPEKTTGNRCRSIHLVGERN
ncbi:hypothetical protein Hanom_Chr03g00185221 [Helianthus anomalus]